MSSVGVNLRLRWVVVLEGLLRSLLAGAFEGLDEVDAEGRTLSGWQSRHIKPHLRAPELVH